MLSENPSLIEGIRKILLQLAEEEISLEESLGYIPDPDEALSHRFNSKVSAYQNKTSKEKDNILHSFKYLTQMELGDYDKDVLFNHIFLLEEVFKFLEQKEGELAAERKAKEEAETRADEERRRAEATEARLREAVRSNFLPMVHGKATDSIVSMVGKPVNVGFPGVSGSVDSGEVTLVLDKINELKGVLGISTHKLLSTAITEFTKQNHIGNEKRRLDCTKVYLKLEEYASLCGYGITEQETFTEEARQKEKKRAENALKEARKKVNKDLSLLFSASLSWSEKVGKDRQDFRDIRLIEAKGIRKGLIEIRFSQTFSEYLVKLPVTQYPTSLLCLDERNSNAYALGLKITTHFNMDNNVIQGTYDRLKVKTLLQIVDLPSYEKVKSQRTSWETRIKDPLEDSLEKLVSCGLLKNYCYCRPKGVAMTDEEATHFPDFQSWENTLISFELQSPPNHNERRANKQKRISQTKAKQPKQKPNYNKKKLSTTATPS